MLHQLTGYIFWSVLTAQNKKLFTYLLVLDGWWINLNVGESTCRQNDLLTKRPVSNEVNSPCLLRFLFTCTVNKPLMTWPADDLESTLLRSTYFHYLVSIHYNRSRSIHSRKSEDTKRNKQRYVNENDYYALLVEKTRHEGNQPV